MKYIKIIILSILFLSVHALEARSFNMDKRWDKTIEATNLQLPKKLDKTMTLEKMSRIDNTIQYFYKLSYTTKSPNMDSLIISTRNNYCKNPQTRAAMFDGYRFYYNYKLATGMLDLEFFISKKHCNE